MKNIGCDTPQSIIDYLAALEAQGYSYSARYTRGRLLKKLGVPPENATREHVLAVIADGDKASTRRVYLACLRNSFHDMRELGIVGHDPTAGLRTPAPPRGVPRPLSDSEVNALMSLGGRVADWTLLGLKAGLRASEVVAVCPEHLEWTNSGWMLRIPRGKGGKDARIPAHPDVVALLQAHQGTPGRIWRINSVTMSTAWNAAAKTVGVRGRRFHDCRHTYASRLFQHTGDLYTVQKLMRHASIQTTTIYAQPDEARQFDAVAGL